MRLSLTAIRIELAKKNWNYTDLSGVAKIPYNTIIGIMNGTRGGSLKTIGKIAKALNVKVEEILDYQEGSE